MVAPGRGPVPTRGGLPRVRSPSLPSQVPSQAPSQASASCLFARQGAGRVPPAPRETAECSPAARSPPGRHQVAVPSATAPHGPPQGIPAQTGPRPQTQSPSSAPAPILGTEGMRPPWDSSQDLPASTPARLLPQQGPPRQGLAPGLLCREGDTQASVG